MYISTVAPIAFLLSIASAQTVYSIAGTTSACAAQPVLEACLASTEAIVASCATTDYGCLCQKWTDVVTCFLQCPNDSRYSSVYSSQQTYCSEASIYTSSTSSAISSAVSSPYSASVTTTTKADTTKSSGAVAVASTSSGATASATASTTSKSGANDLAVNAGGVVAGLLGLVGALL